MADIEAAVVRSCVRLRMMGLKCNYGYFEEELAQYRIYGNKPTTLLKICYHMKPLFQCFGFRDFRGITQEELSHFIAMLYTRNSPATVEAMKRTYKHFFLKLRDEEFVGFIKPKRLFSTLEGKDVLERYEIEKMLSCTASKRDKAMIAVAYDAALRPHEVVGLRTSDIDTSSYPAHVNIGAETKTGKATIPLTFSTSYLLDYINSMPRLAEGWLFIAEGGRDGMGAKLERSGFYYILLEAVELAEIKKRVFPYLLRHSRLTELANTLTEQQLKKFARWKPDSPMIRNYVHLDVKDLDRAIMGMEKPRDDLLLQQLLAEVQGLRKKLEDNRS